MKPSALLMGILNVTPDSFFDGGRYLDPRAAVDHAKRMIEFGADWIDVGGESTRPGAEPISADEEAERVMPVVEILVGLGAQIWVDTYKSSTARLALGVGAAGINDVTALSDPAMATTIASYGASVCLMHMQGNPKTMQANPEYRDVIGEVSEFLRDRARVAQEAGIEPKQIFVDPGFGFGKTTEHNLTLLRELEKLTSLEYPLLVGLSRKSFLGKLASGEEAPIPVEERGQIVELAHWRALEAGASVLRVHDIASAVHTLRLFKALSP